MVGNDELCASFKNLRSADRIDLMCGLVQLCVPLELRFVGAFLEELARKDYTRLKAFETKANDYAALRETRVDELSKDACGTISVYLSLLHSDNSFCAHVLFDTLARIKCLVDAAIENGALLDLELVDDLILLFTMALHHPAFTFSQRLQLYNEYINLKNLLSDFISCIPLKNGNMSEEPSADALLHEVEDEDEVSEVHNSTLCDSEVESACLIEITLKSTTAVEGKTEFIFEIIWSDDSVTNVMKTYPELSEFHRQFVHQFPNYSGVHKQERLLPFFPQENNDRIVRLMKEYFRKFSSLPECCLKCHLVMDFFHDKNSVSLSSSSSSSSSSPLMVVPVTPTTVAITSSCNQTNVSSRNCVENSNSMFTSEQGADRHGSRIRSLTVYNSHLAEHGPKRGSDMSGKPFLRPHMTAVTKTPDVSMTPPFAPVPRHPCVVSEASTVSSLQQTKLCDGSVGCPPVCISPCLSVASACPSPQPPSVSPPQSHTSNSSTDLSQSHSSGSEMSHKQQSLKHHNNNLSANSCHMLQTAEQDEDQHMRLHSTSVQKSKSEQDHRRVMSNGVPPGFGSVVANAATSIPDCQSVTWCVQNFQVQEPTPLIWNTSGIGMPMVIPNSIPKGLALGLHPVTMKDRYDQEQFDVNDQDKYVTGDLYSAVNDDKVSAAYVSQQLTLNSAFEARQGFSVYNPSAGTVRAFPNPWDSITPCYLIPQPLMKPGVTLPVAAAAKPARPILGASHHQGGSKALHQSENGENRNVASAQESSAVSAKSSVTTAVITDTTQNIIASDSNLDLIGHASPVLVSSESALSRPSSLNVSSMTLPRRPKMMNNDLKGGSGSNFSKISASRSVAAISGVDTRGMSGYYADGSANNSSPFPPPGHIMMQRIPDMPAGTQPFPIPSSVSSLPAIHSNPLITSAVPTPSTTPPILPLPPASLTSSDGPCTTCCQCMQCSMQALSTMPYTYPIMWQPGHMYPYSFVNGFINSHNLSFPPPSLPPHIPLGGIFNGMNSDVVYNLTQHQVPAPVPALPPHLSHPSVLNSLLFTSQCVPFHPNYPPPVHIQNPVSTIKPKLCCPNCGSSDHVLGACTETKASVLSQTAQFRLNPGTKQPSE